jgi:hypothetical protein
VPVVYDGRVRPVAEDAVLADVDQLVAAGARHISFADPDFLNAPRHARRVMAAVHDRHPGVTFDATIKVEHLLRYPELPNWAPTTPPGWVGPGRTPTLLSTNSRWRSPPW